MAGVGKGTFAKLACKLLTHKLYKFVHLSLGDILRSFRNGNFLSSEILSADDLSSVKCAMSTGHLISDHFANKIIASAIESSISASKTTMSNINIILDGYPRTLEQADFIEQRFKNNLIVIDIALERWIMTAKLLGRRSCQSCGKDFNIASVVNDEYDMPPILPNLTQCSLERGVPCDPVLVAREDDQQHVIEVRFNEYERKTQPLLEYFKSRAVPIHEFQVKKGIQDIERLVALIKSSSI